MNNAGYLATHPDAGKKQTWKDANGLYAHFLIDVEMTSCQMTSRIKQANSSVQLFVQRCLMNLEPDVAANAGEDDAWRQWKWMKNYRVWEANRKVFLYPENWIEPELRDNKSPFFKDLENELLQNELTLDTAETAFINYLEKLDEVARLEIMGMYHEEEGNRSIFHVFGRTYATPHVYYYRKWVDSAQWTAWEKVDVDIQGDHLIPVVWNRRLYLFWPIFTEKQEKKTGRNASQDLSEGRKYWELQIAWSEYKNGKWLSKKLSSKPNEPSRSHLEKVGIRFESPIDKKYYYFKGYVTVSNGLVVELHLREDVIKQADSKFGDAHSRTCNDLLGMDFQNSLSLINEQNPEPPPYFTPASMMIETASKGSSLKLPKVPAPAKVPVLNKTYDSFRILPSHQDFPFNGQKPFFLQDGSRTFLVTPFEKIVQVQQGWKDGKVNPRVINQYERYFNGITIFSDLMGSAVNPKDPVFSEPTFDISRNIRVSDSTDLNVAETATDFSSDGTRTPITASVSNSPIKARTTMALASQAETPIDLAAEAAKANLIVRTTIHPEITENAFQFPSFELQREFLFQNFYHPFSCTLMRELYRAGIDGLLQRPLQTDPHLFTSLRQAFDFKKDYKPTEAVRKEYPREELDFSDSGSYSLYNWELFFHVPLMIADRLSKNQRFEDAQKWFHYIFDPTDISGLPVPQRYWRTKPFFETTAEDYQANQIQNLLRLLAQGSSEEGSSEEGQEKPSAEDRKRLEEFRKQVDDWRKNPFNPHAIARLRTTAYQKAVVIKYIENLIAWGDQLFRRDSIESINEATQVYILASEILGQRPENIPPRAVPKVHTFNTLEGNLDEFSNALAEIEKFIPALSKDDASSQTEIAPLPPDPTLYFGIPRNDKLLGYWDTVGDRLFKIRHCMNIEGVVRQLPLFEPPIDPALLIKAAAAGIDISSALNDISAALPRYRFNIMAQKASELCTELKSLGAALLSALEKRDAEALALLRSTNEIKVLDAVRTVKEKQIDEANDSLDGLKEYQRVIEARYSYYSSRDFINLFEGTQLALTAYSLIAQSLHMGLEGLASVFHLVPNAKGGAPTTLGLTYGGSNIASSVQSFGSATGILASIYNTIGSVSATLGGYQRRWEDWQHQADLASKELEQVKKQIAAAEIRVAIAEQDLKNHDLQIENAKDVDAFMRDKFTNRELYDWMVGQISSIYFQSYQLAYDVAKRTERAYQFELGLQSSDFIRFGYWDSLKKGLLSGERLYHDLKRMELSYLEQHKREYEITKHVSLAELNPFALLQLKQSPENECYFSLSEVLFDLDCPGHYMRRIKSVSISIPCVTGPYTSVNCTLTLLKSSVRINTQLSGDEDPYKRNPEDNSRFKDSIGAIQSIVTSSAQNDSGLFEPNLRDERYLPFEGAGVISEWRLQLPKDFKQFDYNTISDVILHIRYTAREGGEQLKLAASDSLLNLINTEFVGEDKQGLFRIFSMKHEFPTEWSRLLNSSELAEPSVLKLPINQSSFPFIFSGKTIQLKKLEFFLRLNEEDSNPANKNYLVIDSIQAADGNSIPEPTNPEAAKLPLTMSSQQSPIPTLPYASVDTPKPELQGNQPWQFFVEKESLKAVASVIDDLFIIWHYSVADKKVTTDGLTP
jgi:hypothetical protein